MDPTHDQVAGERHIAVAVGRDYQDAAPTRGVFRGGPAGTLSVSVRIEEEGGAASTGEMQYPPSAAGPGVPGLLRDRINNSPAALRTGVPG